MDTIRCASPVEVRQSPVHGRGSFAAVSFEAGEELGVYPLLILSSAEVEALKRTHVYHYVFYVDEPEQGAMRAAIAFGPISMCNHSPDANAVFQLNAATEVVRLTASRSIAAGDEILIDYEEFAAEAL